MSEIRSPCIRGCCLDQQDICLGCFRSLDEILQWLTSNEQQRQGVLRTAITRQKTRLCRPTVPTRSADVDGAGGQKFG